MPQLLTGKLGHIDYNDDSVFTFPCGLPGFEDQREFIFVQKAETEPLIFMQSTGLPELCFILVPILVADPGYQLEVTADDAEELGLDDRTPRIGNDVLCAAMVCAGEERTPTADLMAPIVANLKNRLGMQIIRSQSGYSHEFSLCAREPVSCS